MYLHSLDGFTQLQGQIEFYVEEHNTQMPHHAFVGRTPDEVSFDQAGRVPDPLTAARCQGDWSTKRRIEELERELRRKENALAEAAALLVPKKSRDLLGAIYSEDGRMVRLDL